MADPADVALTKLARREFNRRKVDASLADIRASHGVIYIRGVVKSVRGGPVDPRAECEHIARILKTKPEIRDVVLDCIFRS